MHTQSLSRVQLCATLWTVAHQAPLSIEFSRQEYWSGLSFPSACSSPGFSICGILQVRILERVAISLSRVSSPSTDRTQVSHIVGRFFTVWATREAQLNTILKVKNRMVVSGLPPCLGIAWKIRWTEEPGGLQSIGWQRVGYDWMTKHQKNKNISLT